MAGKMCCVCLRLVILSQWSSTYFLFQLATTSITYFVFGVGWKCCMTQPHDEAKEVTNMPRVRVTSHLSPDFCLSDAWCSFSEVAEWEKSEWRMSRWQKWHSQAANDAGNKWNAASPLKIHDFQERVFLNTVEIVVYTSHDTWTAMSDMLLFKIHFVILIWSNLIVKHIHHCTHQKKVSNFP